MVFIIWVRWWGLSERDWEDRGSFFIDEPKIVCQNPGLNQGPLDLQSNALPTELFRPAIAFISHIFSISFIFKMRSQKRSQVFYKSPLCIHYLKLCFSKSTFWHSCLLYEICCNRGTVFAFSLFEMLLFKVSNYLNFSFMRLIFLVWDLA